MRPDWFSKQFSGIFCQLAEKVCPLKMHQFQIGQKHLVEPLKLSDVWCNRTALQEPLAERRARWKHCWAQSVGFPSGRKGKALFSIHGVEISEKLLEEGGVWSRISQLGGDSDVWDLQVQEVARDKARQVGSEEQQTAQGSWHPVGGGSTGQRCP